MMRRIFGYGLLLCAVALPWWNVARGDGLIEFSAAELNRILSHGPWPPPWSSDPSNRVSGQPDAAEFGEYLFFENRLSRAGTLSCGSCHVPERDWSDGLARGVGMREVDRNTPNLVNVRYHRWFGWDGAADSLWSQSIRPILNERELAATPEHVGQLLRADRDLSCRYEKAFGKPPAAVTDEALLVDIGKALAAFQETIIGAPTRFDEFRDALARGDRASAARYSQAAQRGLQIFVGRGNCSVCHSGATFSNDGFHSAGGSSFTGKSRADPGRYEGVKELRASRFNLLGAYNDDPARATATGTRDVALDPRNVGEFRVPSLRNAALTGPYMHDGRIGTLREVVRHYSELDVTRLQGADGQLLKPLKLTSQESSDLIVFLESISDYRTVWKRNMPADESACRS